MHPYQEQEESEFKKISNEKELMKDMPQGKNKNKKSSLVLILVLLAVLVLLILNGFYFKIGWKKTSTPNQQTINVKTTTQKTADVPSTLFSGSLKPISDKLGLIDKNIWSNFYSSGEEVADFDYFEAGTYISGNYKDYKRIIAIERSIGPGSPVVKVFATNDNQKYILDGDPADVGKYGADDWQNPLYGIDRDKISKVEKLDSDHPDRIDAGGNFVLYKGQVPVDYTLPAKEGGPLIWKISNNPGYKETKNIFNDLKLLIADGYEKPSGYADSDASVQNKINQLIKYTSGRSSVIFIDSTGLPYIYHLGDKVSTIANIKSGDLTNSSGLYKEYGYAFPGACYGQPDTLIAKEITDSDLEKIGNIQSDGIDVYKLKDSGNPLLKIAYDQKTDFMYTGDYNQPYTITSETDRRPTYDAYIKDNPLIFFKDPLGRWEMFVEYEYLMPGGCGKPVLYFYPAKTTDVSVKFGKEVLLARDIPKYNNGWKISADPDGILHDLQPQLTDCGSINTDEKGSEYASLACQKNSYPYIYWAGDVIGSQYPVTNQGWSVARGDLPGFMDDKLSYIGLNDQEKKDMLAYWVPEMLDKGADYYKVSFFQNQTMDQFIPMEITPKPDSIGRVFLDWTPLKNSIKIAPQNLTKIERNGFTVIEWGGIKR